MEAGNKQETYTICYIHMEAGNFKTGICICKTVDYYHKALFYIWKVIGNVNYVNCQLTRGLGTGIMYIQLYLFNLQPL